MNHTIKICAISMLISILAACGGGSGGGGNAPTPAPSPKIDGTKVYMEPQANGNTFACAHCHSLTEPSNDMFTRPGHAIGDAMRRSDYKNGLIQGFVSAVNVCLDTWMKVPTPWTEDTPEYVALTEFLTERDDVSKPTLDVKVQKAEPLVFENDNSDVTGNPTAGRDFFNESCAICHGEGATGTNRAPSLTGRFNYDGSGNYISRKVRLSGPLDHSIYQGEALSGVMPFWAEDRISDDDLHDVIAFLINSRLPGVTPAPIPTPTGNPSGGCDASDHPKVGQSASLRTLAHGVSGTATFIDNCTIEISNFNFDGGGIDVRAYGGNGNFSTTGFAMGGNLVRNRSYNNETLTFKLPGNKTLDDIDRISIWCVPVKASFGDGEFN